MTNSQTYGGRGCNLYIETQNPFQFLGEHIGIIYTTHDIVERERKRGKPSKLDELRSNIPIRWPLNKYSTDKKI